MLFELLRQNIGTEDPDPDWLRDTPQWERRLHRWFPLWALAKWGAWDSHRQAPWEKSNAVPDPDTPF